MKETAVASEPRLSPHHDLVGGIPEVLGPWQLELLKDHGLRPEHTLLDLGCGTLRFGLVALEYLDPDRYVGVDPGRELIALGRQLAEGAGTLSKARAIADLEWLDAQEPMGVDFVLAQSVLNHLDEPGVRATVHRVARHLGERGRWLGTASFASDVAGVVTGRAHPRRPGEFVHTRMSFSWFAELLAKQGLAAERLPNHHPRGLHAFVAFFGERELASS